MIGSLLTILLLLCVLAITVYLLSKLRNVHLLLFQLQTDIADVKNNALTDLFNQLNIVGELNRRLDLAKPLPSMRFWAASPDFLYLLLQHALQEKPQTIVECGSGVSTIVLARCAKLNGGGHVYSLDHEPHYAAQTRQQLAEFGLNDYATVLDAPLCIQAVHGEQLQWYTIIDLPSLPIDMLVVDGPPQASAHQARYPVAPLLFAQMTAGAAAFFDDASTTAMRDVIERWRREFPEYDFEERQAEKGCVILRKPERSESTMGGMVHGNYATLQVHQRKSF